MSGFKLLAIRPLINCGDRFLSNLTPGHIYKFHQDYDFLDKDGREITENNLTLNDDEGNERDNWVNEIKKVNLNPIDLYKITTTSGNDININIAAIVGKNGSGKSTLLELLYALCYAITTKKGIIPNHSDLKEYINNKDINHNKLFKKINEIQNFYSDLRVEVFYEIDNEFFNVSYYDDQLIFHKEIKNSDHFKPFIPSGYYNPDVSTERKYQFVFDKLFFYTISINYSLYGLNTKNDSSWLGDLFHKNDGYQTPLVINPYRTEGNIDVNSELHLAQSRMLSNLVDDSFNSKTIINNKPVHSIKFILDYNQFNTFRAFNFDMVYNKIKEKLELSDAEFITQVYNAVYTTKGSRISQFDISKVENSEMLVKYVYRKILKIHTQYDEYRLINTPDNIESVIPSFISIFKSLIKLRDDRSHITLKLRQILNILRFNPLYADGEIKWIEESDDFQKIPNKVKKHFFTIGLDRFIRRIRIIQNLNPNLELIEIIPAACYRPNLYIDNNSNKNSVTNFQSLSSGEQHFIHSIQSILYHISNINSVFDSKTDKIRYNYINLVFDEIELYYHPSFQKAFIKELLNGIKNLKIPNIKGVNILFSTHSPFILSDIPNYSILKLNNGTVDLSNTNSFAANVHDILADDFFLDDGFMGNFAKAKINEVIEQLKYFILENEVSELQNRQNSDQASNQVSDLLFLKLTKVIELRGRSGQLTKEYCLSLINIVNEPLLSYKLKEMYNKAFPEEYNKIEAINKAKQILGDVGLNFKDLKQE